MILVIVRGASSGGRPLCRPTLQPLFRLPWQGRCLESAQLRRVSDWQDAFDAVWNPPTRDKDFRTNSRHSGNVFYSENLPVDDLDWTGLTFSGDYYVALLLLPQNYQNRVSPKYRG